MESFSHLEIEIYAWSDSSIVLHWLSALPRKWNTFVANRTSKILNYIPRNRWRHVATKDNPADCASRGTTPIELIVHPLWWRGPSWLSEAEYKWPAQPAPEIHVEDLPEKRSTVTSLKANIISQTKRTYTVENELLKKRSNLHSIRRILAWIQRFRYNIVARKRGKIKVSNQQLTPKEIDDACLKLAQAAQHDCFQGEMDCLTKNTMFPTNNKLKNLYPFIDADGTLRVGGRLQNSNQPYDVRHPIIIPKNHLYTQRLLSEIHLHNLHAGPTLMIATLNQKYWTHFH